MIWSSSPRKTAMLLIMCILLTGCGTNKLPDPQVVPGPVTALPTAADTDPTETATPGPFPSPLPVLPTMEPTKTPVTLGYEVPVLSQEGLLLDGAPTGVGCVPVCIEMITSYWNGTDSRYPVLSAQEVIDRNAEQGLYVAGRGMTSASAADELAEIEYVHRMELNSSKEELLAAFKAHGPVGVLVKTNWVPTTMNHAAVLTTYDEATDTVTLNDPFYGSTVTWSWDSFDGIWGLNYAGDKDYSGNVVRRVYFSIYPKDRS